MSAALAYPPPPPPLHALSSQWAAKAVANEHFDQIILPLVALGLPLFPVRENAKFPPLFDDFPNKATTDANALRAMWTRPDGQLARYNPAVATGGNLFVIDIDIPGDQEAIGQVLEELGLAGLATYRVRTPSGGLHVYLRAAGVRCSVKRVHPKVDVRGEGGYVLAAGAVTPAGRYVAL